MKIARDKKLHFVGSIIIFLISATFFQIFTILNPFIFGFFITLFAGICKEIYDIPRTGFSSGDILADIAGIIAGMILFKIALLLIFYFN